MARDMYPYRENIRKGEVVSTLIYGTAWDEIIRFLKTNEKYKNIDKDSTGFGNVGVKCNTSGIDYTNSVIKTGSNEKYSLNNIYDFVGNVCEWTMEAYIGTSNGITNGRIFRPSGYYFSAYYYPVSSRSGSINTNTSVPRVGGRVQLYIK